MGLIKTLKDIIYKIKDYDRLEMDYCGLLDYATGGILSKPNYTMESVYEAVSSYLQQRDEFVREDYLKELKEDAKGGTVQRDFQILMDDGAYIDLDPSMSMKPSFDVKEGERIKLIIIKED